MTKETTQASAIGAHLTPEMLAAYHEKRLSADAAETVREHLTLCDDCAAWLLELAALADDEAPSPELSEHELAAAWRKQRDRRPLSSPEIPNTKQKPLPASTAYRGWAVAALFAILCLGLSWWNLNLRQQLSVSIKPQVNPPLVSLEPEEPKRSTPDSSPSVTLAPESRGWLILNDLYLSDFTSLRVEFRDLSDHTIWLQEGLKANEAGNIRLEIVAKFLPPGDYTIIVTATNRNPEEPISFYRLRVTRSTD